MNTDWQQVSLFNEPSTEVYVEVVVRGGREEVGLLDTVPFDRVSKLLGDIAHGVGQSLRKTSATKAVAELGIEFGLEEGKLVALIARGRGKANLTLRLEWEQSSAKVSEKLHRE